MAKRKRSTKAPTFRGRQADLIAVELPTDTAAATAELDSCDVADEDEPLQDSASGNREESAAVESTMPLDDDGSFPTGVDEAAAASLIEQLETPAEGTEAPEEKDQRLFVPKKPTKKKSKRKSVVKTEPEAVPRQRFRHILNRR